ncbi:MAG: SufS family cysteine desulfurase [Verrucomicrobiales bacterium]|nr:cysteine desulfurase [Verrucomicrobiales bacterium]MDB4711833.1 cysteine desulfurase [Verrucomicrobiales bacterium]NCG26633.1 SufS family cysteine desulfurase [Verrucomicrobiales bacterium]
MKEDTDLRKDFPILSQKVHGNPLIYLDNAATTQKPQAVIDRLSDFLSKENANIHRGVHYLSMNATTLYDEARSCVANFINANHEDEIIFVRGATEAINLVARSFCNERLEPGDEILITEMEHHANIVPWQLVAGENGARVVPAPITDEGEIDIDQFESLLNERTKLVAFVHVSNALGTINSAKKLVDLAHQKGIPVLVDGAQAVAHQKVDVQDIGCDFYVFSSHKIFGPDGVGVLYGRKELLNKMTPYQGGGDMIEIVSFDGTTFRPSPERFEAGTPNISGAIGLKAAIDYVNDIGWETIHKKESLLLDHANESLGKNPSIKLVGTAENKVPVVSFTIDSAHPHDIATILDTKGIAVRAGHHCTQPLMKRLGLSATTRASLSFYNTIDEINQLTEALKEISALFES